MRRILIAGFAATLIAMPLAACNKAPAATGASASAAAAAAAAASKAFLEENGKKPGVTTLPSGVQYKITTSGPATGKSPGPHDEVKVHYEGKLINGTVFDSSLERGVPASFGVDQVIPGWTEILQHMKPGDDWMVYIPPEKAYGEPPEEHGADQIPPNSALIFRVQLIDVLPGFGG